MTHKCCVRGFAKSQRFPRRWFRSFCSLFCSEFSGAAPKPHLANLRPYTRKCFRLECLFPVTIVAQLHCDQHSDCCVASVSHLPVKKFVPSSLSYPLFPTCTEITFAHNFTADFTCQEHSVHLRRRCSFAAIKTGATNPLELSAAAMARATCQQTESREEGSAPLTLTDMLHIVPSMFETMSSDAKRILLTVNCAFRKHLHETADVVVADWTDVPLIAKGGWACLHSVTLTDEFGSTHSVLRSGDLPLPGLQQVHWPCLKHLSLSGVWLSSITMSQLVEVDLPYLEDLDLSNGKRTHGSLRLLTKLGEWPLMKRLNLSQNKLKRAGVALLAQADWPILEQLVLSKCRLDAACTVVLADASWPELKWLHLDGNSFWYQRHGTCWFPSCPLLECADLSGGPEWDERPGAHSVLCAVVNAQWSHLKHLDLSGRHHELGSPDVLCLTRGHWPGLSTLSLSGSLLRCELLESIAHLVHASWPVLQDLDLSRQCDMLDDDYWLHEHAAMLSQGTWPMLKKLSLSYNMMCEGCMAMLAQGHWPLLEALEMTYCGIDRYDVSGLLMSNWPLMQNLDLSGNSKELRFAKLASNHAILSMWPLLQRLNDVELSHKPAHVNYCSIVQKQTRRMGLRNTYRVDTALKL